MVLRPYSVPCGPRSTSIRVHIEDIEHCALRACDVNIVHIQAHARLEPHSGVLGG